MTATVQGRHGTSLKCVFDSTGRFSQDIDLDATHPDDFKAEIRWTDISGLSPRGLQDDPEEICRKVRGRFAFLSATTEHEARVLVD